MATMTGDQAALAILLGKGSASQKQRKLTQLAQQAKARIEGRVECPECGSEGPHDSQLDEGREEFMCAGCGLSFYGEG